MIDIEFHEMSIKDRALITKAFIHLALDLQILPNVLNYSNMDLGQKSSENITEVDLIKFIPYLTIILLCKEVITLSIA